MSCEHKLCYNKADDTWECEFCDFWINRMDMDWIEKQISLKRLIGFE